MTESDSAPGVSDADSLYVMRASARPWARLLGVSATLLIAGVAASLSGAVAPGMVSTIVAVGVVVSFVALVASGAVMTARWRTSLQFADGSLIVRTPLGARAIPVRDGVGFVRWLDPGSLRPVIWVVDRRALIVPISEWLEPLQVEAFAMAVGLQVIDLDDPPSSIVR